MSAKKRIKRSHDKDRKPHPNVRAGFSRDDLTAEYEKFHGFNGFYARRQPAIGQMVKLQLDLSQQMGEYCGDPVTWCLMGGRVIRVLDDGSVEVLVRPSSDNAPLELEKVWRGLLVFDPEYRYPWVLLSLAVASEEEWSAMPRSTKDQALPDIAAGPL